MQAYMPYLWLGVVFCAAIAEALGRRMIALWMIPGGVVASVFAFLRLPVWAQIIAFIGVSTLCCFLFFRICGSCKPHVSGKPGTENRSFSCRNGGKPTCCGMSHGGYHAG